MVIIGAATCGTCKFGRLVPEDIRVRECRGVPPTPAIAGMTAEGPAVMLLRARLPSTEDACALYKRIDAIGATEGAA